MDYYCVTCSKTIKFSKQSISRHNSSMSHKSRDDKKTKIYICECGNNYLHRQSLYNHKQNCTSVTVSTIQNEDKANQPDQTQIIENLQKENKSLQEKNKALQEENTQLKRQLKGIKRVTPSMRQMVANNQERKCGQCSNDLQTYFQVDHIIGKQFGGDNSLENLMALCGECHNQKSALENIKREQIKQAIQNILQEPTPNEFICIKRNPTHSI